MKILIKDLRFNCIIGLLEEERITEQEVVLHVEIDYDYKDSFINYAEVAELLQNHLVKMKYELIETALEDIFPLLKSTFPLIKFLHVEITKPNILPNCEVSVSNIKIY